MVKQSISSCIEVNCSFASKKYAPTKETVRPLYTTYSSCPASTPSDKPAPIAIVTNAHPVSARHNRSSFPALEFVDRARIDRIHASLPRNLTIPILISAHRASGMAILDANGYLHALPVHRQARRMPPRYLSLRSEASESISLRIVKRFKIGT